MAARSLQGLCRAAFSLGGAASTSAPLAAQPALTGLLGVGGGVQQAAAAAAGLRHLVRQLHVSPERCWAAGDEGPTINPLQQAPTPAVAASSPMGTSGVPFGMVPLADNPEALRSRAIQNKLSISPRKLNAFAAVVRGLHIEDALIQCSISPKKAAKLVAKALLSAKANAVNNQGLDEQRLRVAEAWVGRGTHLRRNWPHGRGRSGLRLKYRANITVVLREEEQEPRRKTKVIPQLMERTKLWRIRKAQGVVA